MSQGIAVRRASAQDAPRLSSLVRRTFLQFVADTYRPRGVRRFLRQNSPRGLLRRLRRGQLVLTAATRGEPGHPGATATGEGRNGVEAATAAADRAGGTIESIVGVIAVRNGSHVSLLFVDPSLHGRGIGRRLFAAALMEMRRRQPDLDCVTVNSSDFAIPFYRALGFEPSSEPFFSKGTKITPMRNILR